MAHTGSASKSESEEIRSINHKWSLSRAINQVRSGGRLEGAEAEWATEAAREFRGSGLQMAGDIGIPAFALQRAETGAADKFMATGAGDGSGFVSTDVPFAIEALRAPTVLESLGAVTVQATGNLKFPRISTKATADIASEISDVESAGLQLDDLTMSPQRAAMNTTYSKQLLTQGGSEVERLIAGDLRAALAEIVDVKGFEEIMAEASNDLSSAGAQERLLMVIWPWRWKLRF